MIDTQRTSPLRLPGLWLAGLGALSLLAHGQLLPNALRNVFEQDLASPEGIGFAIGTALPAVFGLVGGAASVAAGLSMSTGKNYAVAVGGTLVALVPIASPCFVLGIPVAIWALILLRKPEIRQRFP